MTSIDIDRRVMDEDCAGDKKHCACVPVLRKRIAELENLLLEAQWAAAGNAGFPDKAIRDAIGAAKDG